MGSLYVIFEKDSHGLLLDLSLN